MATHIERVNLKGYVRSILHRKNLSVLFYTVVGIAVVFLVTLLFLTLLRNIKMIFFIILFLFLGVVTDSMNRFLPISVGVELIMLGTVLVSVVYSPVLGMMVGIISLTISELFIMRFKIGLIFSFIGLTAVAFLSHIFADSDITTLGIVLTIAYDAFIIPGYWFTGSNPVKMLIFAATHIAFNVWVFTTLAPFFLRLMT